MAKPKAKSGIMINWAKTPTKTLLGALKTALKSWAVRVSPIPNMIMPNKNGMYGAIHFEVLGKIKAIMAKTITHRAKVRPINRLKRSNMFMQERKIKIVNVVMSIIICKNIFDFHEFLRNSIKGFLLFGRIISQIVMDKKQKINILNILLVITAGVMFVIGYRSGLLAPSVTGIGFLLIAWIFYTQNQ